jgi:hypothetical protein
MCQIAKMSHVPYVEVTSSRGYYLGEVISQTWHSLRIMLFLMSILYATLLLVSYGINRKMGGTILVHNTTVHISPLQVLLNKGHRLAEEIL